MHVFYNMNCWLSCTCPEENRPVVRSRPNIKMGLNEMGCEVVD
jgi:hypothetical protein